jgi:hypothetical protein
MSGLMAKQHEHEANEAMSVAAFLHSLPLVCLSLTAFTLCVSLVGSWPNKPAPFWLAGSLVYHQATAKPGFFTQDRGCQYPSKTRILKVAVDTRPWR